MKSPSAVASITIGALLCCLGTLHARSGQAEAVPASLHPSRAVLDQYCVTCHNEKLKTAGLLIDHLDPLNVAENPEAWEKVVAKLQAGMMPPPGLPRPDALAVSHLVGTLESELDAFGAEHPFAGAPGIHRLTRAEYAASVQDLLGVDVDPAALPPDQASFGFDDNEETLSITPALLQRYLATAGRIAGQLDRKNPKAGRVFVCTPISTANGRCAQVILARLARLGFRRPVKSADVAPLLEQFKEGSRAASFDEGIRRAVQLLLVDPEFLYRAEHTPTSVRPGTLFKLNDFDLASRLSFLLWSSGPDQQLLDLAQHGRLSDPAVLEQQTIRMLQDPRASRFASNFAGQWFGLRAIDEPRPDPGIFRQFNENVRDAMARELQLFLENELRENRSIVNLLHADYTYVNPTLARYYGIDGVTGSDFQRVTLKDPARFGLLGKGAVLLVTSYADRTSPVLRGKWILENLLGAPVPAAPPVVPSLPDADTGALRTLRDRLEQHRRNPACATCHAVMDPLGLALENFDAAGKLRDREAGAPVDAKGTLVDGTTVNGPTELHDALVGRADQFVQTFAEKLMTYALGRGLDYRDQPEVRAVVRRAAGQEYRWSALITAVVESTEFRMARQPDAEP